MEPLYEKLFQHFSPVQARPDLARTIMVRIYRQKKMKAQIRFGFFSLLLLVSVGMLIPLGNSLRLEMVQSGFFDFLSLSFSHFSDVLVSWQDYVLSLLEYVPAFSITCFLALIFTLFLSLRLLFRDLKTVFSQPFLP